jgi:hypothetical protein
MAIQVKRPKLPEGKITKRRIIEDQKNRCGRKRKYSDPKRANDAANVLQMRERNHISAYECPYCHYWHIGHTPYSQIPPEDRLSEKELHGE